MSKPIQLIPPGFMGFFQLKASGRNPDEMLDQVRPGVDMTDWYFQSRLLDFTQTVALPQIALANGITGLTRFSPNAIAVPIGEAWWVEEYTITTNGLGAATERCQYAPAYFYPLVGTLNTYQVGDPSPDITGAADARANIARARQFFVPPGAELGFRSIINASAGSITYTASLRFARLPI